MIFAGYFIVLSVKLKYCDCYRWIYQCWCWFSTALILWFIFVCLNFWTIWLFAEFDRLKVIIMPGECNGFCHDIILALVSCWSILEWLILIVLLNLTLHIELWILIARDSFMEVIFICFWTCDSFWLGRNCCSDTLDIWLLNRINLFCYCANTVVIPWILFSWKVHV